MSSHYQNMTVDELVEASIAHGEHVYELENNMNLISQELTARGTSVDKVLTEKERKKENEQT